MKFNQLINQYLNEAKIRNRTIAVVPGAFRPPHKAHLDMVKFYASKADKVLVLISPDTPSTKKKRVTPEGRYISYDVSKEMWDNYLQAAGLASKVTTMISPSPSPVSAAYEFVANKDNSSYMAQPGEHVILGVSTKGGDEIRFQKTAQDYAREGVTVEVIPFKAPTDLSATQFRAAIDSALDKNSIRPLMSFLPKNVDPNSILQIFRQI